MVWCAGVVLFFLLPYVYLFTATGDVPAFAYIGVFLWMLVFGVLTVIRIVKEVRADDVRLGTGELQAHDESFEAAEDEEGEGGDEITGGNLFVIRLGQKTDESTSGLPGFAEAPRLFRVRVIERRLPALGHAHRRLSR